MGARFTEYAQRLRALSRLREQRRLFRSARWPVLVAACALIVGWQWSFVSSHRSLDDDYRVLASGGITHEAQFLPYLVHHDLFPLARLSGELPHSPDQLQRLLKERPGELVTELSYVIRAGDLLGVYLYLPSVAWNGTTREPTIRVANGIAFVAALLAVFVACWTNGLRVLGLLLVALLGSNPFQLYEVYANENLFGWPITIGALVLAVHIPLIGARPRRWLVWSAPIVTGVLLGCAQHIRSEPLAMIGSAILVYATLSRAPWRVRVALIAIVLGTTWVTAATIRAGFERKIAHATQVLADAGGEPWTGDRRAHHSRWHPIWCGLADFSADKVYQWRDVAAAKRALLKIGFDPGGRRFRLGAVNLRGRAAVHIDVEGPEDDAVRYPRLPVLVPGYEEALRDDILSDIRKDPLWLVGVILKRCWRVLNQTSPPRLSLGGAWVTVFAGGGYVFLALLVSLALARAWPRVKLLLLMVPTSATAILIFSGRGIPYYSAYHLVAVALLGALGVELALTWRKRRSEPKRP